jgi:hypothetical protein
VTGSAIRDRGSAQRLSPTDLRTQCAAGTIPNLPQPDGQAAWGKTANAFWNEFASFCTGLVSWCSTNMLRDGNKRIGFLAVVTFLGVNGYDFSATDAEVVAEILALADGAVSEEALADWIREHSSRRR